MKSIIRITGILALSVSICLMTSSCGKKGGPPAFPPISVKIAPAVKVDAPVVIDAFGNTEERMSVEIVPQVSGQLVKTFMQDGAVVTNGQPLFRIDDRDYVARVQQVEGMVKADKANLELARSTLERNKPLYEKKLISTESFDTIRTKVQAIDAQLQMDEAALEQAKLNLSRCTVVAPLAGVCSKRYVDEGNLVGAGATRLTNVRSYDPIRVAFSVSEQYLPTIRQAMAAGKVKIEITPRGDTNSYSGTLEFVDNAVNPMTGTILLRGEVSNPELKLWANQFVDVDIHAGMVAGAVMVPESAVQIGKRGSYLFAVTKEGKADMRPVKTGVRLNDMIQIVEGVAVDENIVALGQFMLFQGASVMDLSKMAKDGMAPGAERKSAGDGEQKSESKKAGQETK